jgi:AcrR family transcriptional regulator
MPTTLPRGRGALPRPQVLEAQRSWILEGLVQSVAAHGYANTSVSQIILRAGVSKTTFYGLFASKEDAFLAAYDAIAGRISVRVGRAFEAHEGWATQITAALQELLSILDANPAWTRVCVVESLAAGPSMVERHNQTLGSLQALVDRGAGALASDSQGDTFPAESVAGAIHGIIFARASGEPDEPLGSLLAGLAYLTIVPYVGVQRAAQELSAIDLPILNPGPPVAALSSDAPLAWSIPYQAQRCLRYIAEHPGVSSQEVRKGLAIKHLSQVSRLLTRLDRRGLATTPRARGIAHAWSITSLGKRVLAAIDRIEASGK